VWRRVAGVTALVLAGCGSAGAGRSAAPSSPSSSPETATTATVAGCAMPPSTGAPYVGGWRPVGEAGTGLIGEAPVASTVDRAPLTLDAAVTDVLGQMAGTALLGANVVDPPAVAGPTAPWLEVFVTSASETGPDAVAAQWQARLFAGAVADATAQTADLSDAVGGVDVGFVLDDCTTVADEQAAIGHLAAHQVFSSPPDDQLVADARSVADSMGLELVATELFHVGGATAMRAVVETPDVQHFVDQWQPLLSALRGEPGRLVGLQVEVRLPDGEALVAGSSSVRTGSGTLWLRPGTDRAALGIGGPTVPAPPSS